ncbi:MAG: hypothetical protein PT977_14925 [Acidobacteriota bacterium]|nr:hypothetical protein [Acidobacteriota bacterium]
MTDVGEVVRLLAESRVRFILIGGAAANVYGSARHTEKDLEAIAELEAIREERETTGLR